MNESVFLYKLALFSSLMDYLRQWIFDVLITSFWNLFVFEHSLENILFVVKRVTCVLLEFFKTRKNRGILEV